MFRIDVSAWFIAVECGGGLNRRQAPARRAVRAGSTDTAIGGGCEANRRHRVRLLAHLTARR